MAEKYSNVLLIGGNARKSGKTSFICNILSALGQEHPIVAMKIALYTDIGDLQSHYNLEQGEEYYEIRETEPSGKKDSSRYVEAGAMEGWFIAAMENENSVKKILEQVDFLTETGRLIIMESNRFRKSMEPGLFLMVNQKEKEDKSGAKSFQQMSDLIVEPDSDNFHAVKDYLTIEEKQWILKNE
jgi:hypothetical protein